ncbi:MAG: hypothetical protein KBB01_00790 [Candidatus Omnitrophica bacterium]|nr:hypothetical protein [Candidatus Omnitrophota bacterium]
MDEKRELNRVSRRKPLEMRFYENLLKGRPNFVEVLISLGDIYTKKGLYREGLAVDRKLADLRPEDPIVHYNLACSLSLLGEVKEAMVYLKKAVLLGYDEFEYILKDPDLENIRKLPGFDKFFNKLKIIK